MPSPDSTGLPLLSSEQMICCRLTKLADCRRSDVTVHASMAVPLSGATSRAASTRSSCCCKMWDTSLCRSRACAMQSWSCAMLLSGCPPSFCMPAAGMGDNLPQTALRCDAHIHTHSRLIYCSNHMLGSAFTLVCTAAVNAQHGILHSQRHCLHMLAGDRKHPCSMADAARTR